MTPWHLIAGYVGCAALYVVGLGVVGVVNGFGRPATEAGHLDFEFRIGKIGKWFLISALFLTPLVIVFASYDSHSNTYSDRRDRTTSLLVWYMIIGLIWMVRMQLRINKLEKRLAPDRD